MYALVCMCVRIYVYMCVHLSVCRGIGGKCTSILHRDLYFPPTYTYMYLHTCIIGEKCTSYACFYLYVCMYVHVYIYIYIYMYVYVCTYTNVQRDWREIQFSYRLRDLAENTSLGGKYRSLCIYTHVCT